MSFSSGKAHQKAMNDLALLVTADAIGAMQLSGSTDPRKVAGTLREVTPSLIENYSRVAGVLSSAYFMNQRLAAGIQSQFTPELVLPDFIDATDAAVGFTASRLVTTGDFATATTIFSGMVSKTVLNVDRDSLLLNIENDRAKYRRIASPTACTFCLYTAVNSFSTFSPDITRYHDHCRCTVVPEWDDVAVEQPAYYREFEDLQQEAKSRIAIRRDAVFERWYAEELASGRRLGKSTDRRFLAQYPDLAFTQRNYFNEVRRIRTGN